MRFELLITFLLISLFSISQKTFESSQTYNGSKISFEYPEEYFKLEIEKEQEETWYFSKKETSIEQIEAAGGPSNGFSLFITIEEDSLSAEEWLLKSTERGKEKGEMEVLQQVSGKKFKGGKVVFQEQLRRTDQYDFTVSVAKMDNILLFIIFIIDEDTNTKKLFKDVWKSVELVKASE